MHAGERREPGCLGIQTGPAGPVVLEGLAATGLRAIRYAREVAGLGQVIANDVDADAVAAMHTNVSANEVRNRVTVSNDDARIVMLRHPQVHPWSCQALVTRA